MLSQVYSAIKISYVRMVLAMLLVMLLSGVASNAQAQQDWTHYVDPKFGFSFDYPSNWQLFNGKFIDADYQTWHVQLIQSGTPYVGIDVLLQSNPSNFDVVEFVLTRGIGYSSCSYCPNRDTVSTETFNTPNGIATKIIGYPSKNEISINFILDGAILSFQVVASYEGVPLFNERDKSQELLNTILDQISITVLLHKEKIRFTPKLKRQDIQPMQTADNFILPLDTMKGRYDWQNPYLTFDGKNWSNCYLTLATILWHTGDDGFSNTTTPIRAVANGKVINKATWAPGTAVLIEHTLPSGSKIYSFYAHLGTVQVHTGDTVSKGSTIGFLYNQPPNTHLHWEMRNWSTPPPYKCPGVATHDFGAGYTYPGHPGEFGYLCPTCFVKSHSGDTPITPPAPDPQLILDIAKFIKNIISNLINGTVALPNQPFVEPVQVQNAGSTAWGNGYQLVFVGGDRLANVDTINVPSTAAGGIANLLLNLTAPDTPGQYNSQWQLRNPNGTYFGDPIWTSITVQGTTQASDLEVISVNYPTTVSPGQTFRPEITVKLNSGSLLQTRGDMLRNIDGNRYGAYPHVAVVGSVGPGQSYTFQFYANNPMTAPTSQGNYTSKWRVWADGRYIGPEISLDFRVFQGNSPPPAPQLHQPNDYDSAHDDPSFCANTPTDPDGDAITGFQFEVVTGPTAWQGAWMNPPYTCSDRPALTHGDYTWRARVRDSHGNVSDWSNVFHFTKQSGLNITQFSFSPSSPSAQEHITIYTDGDVPTGETILEFNTANDGSKNGEWQGIRHYSGALDLGTNHQTDWYTIDAVSDGLHVVRLTIKSNGGTAVQEQIYNVQHRRPAKPYGLWPVDHGATHDWTNNRTVTFKWKSGLLQTHDYQLVVSDAPNPFSDPTPLLNQTFHQETTEYTYTFGQDYNDLYWYIAATNDLGTSIGGSSYHFGIDLTPPSSAIQTLPTTSLDSKITVQWSGADTRSGLRWYDVQVREDSQGEWHDWLVNTTKTTAIFTGQLGRTYYFRVRAMDEVGNWEAYPSGDGDTHTLIDPTAAALDPWWNNSYVFKRNLVVLSGASVPTGYTIHLHFDATTVPTAQEIYNASQTSIKGNDVRVVYQNSLELNRFVQHFEANQIDLWVATQANISGNSADTNYQLYYGNPTATNPPADMGNVFFPRADGNTVLLAHFQEGSGTTVHDYSGHGHDGSFSNAGWAEGRFGNAGQFNGSSSEVNFGNSGDFNLSAMTLEAWILLDGQTDYPHIFNKETYWLRITGDRRLHAKIFGGEVSGTCPILDLGKWYHVAATFNGSNDLRLYVNGQQCNQKTESHSPNHTSAPLKLGWTTNWPTSGYFFGKIQHVRVSNIARTDFPFSRQSSDPEVQAGNLILPAAAGSPDLVLQSMSTYPVDGNTFEQGVIIQAIVKNQGDSATVNGFQTNFYANHLPTGSGDFAGSIHFTVNDPIAAGTTVTLTTLITDLSTIGGLRTARQLVPMAESTATLYGQTDSAGVVKEADNTNNIFGDGTNLCIAGLDSYEGNDNGLTTTNILALNTAQTHNIHALMDEDWLKLNASANTTYLITTANLGPSSDTYLYLYDTDGVTVLTTNDDYNNTLASQIEWTAPATGVYYVVAKQWNPNVGGCGTAYNITVSETTNSGDTIALQAGWNLFSFRTTPPNAAVNHLLSPVSGHYDRVLGENGLYAPSLPNEFNTLTQLQAGRGYYLHLTDTTVLQANIDGPRVLVDTPITLHAGWNWVGYLPQTALPVTTALQSIDGQYQRILGLGLTYIPSLPDFSTLSHMEPGKGYLIYANNPTSLVYPTINISTTINTLASNSSSSCADMSPTPYLTLIYGQVEINGSSAPIGTRVEAVTPRGEIAGCFIVQSPGRFGLIQVYGEDTIVSPTIGGFRPNEVLDIRVNGQRTKVSIELPWQDDKAPHLMTLNATIQTLYLPLITKK